MPAGNWRLWTHRLAPVAALLTIVGGLPLQSEVAGTGATGTVTTGTAATGPATTGPATTGPATTGTAATGTVTTTPVSALESWAAAAFEAGANAAGEGSAVVPQLLDPSVHPHTLLAPSAAQAESSSTTRGDRGIVTMTSILRQKVWFALFVLVIFVMGFGSGVGTSRFLRFGGPFGHGPGGATDAAGLVVRVGAGRSWRPCRHSAATAVLGAHRG